MEKWDVCLCLLPSHGLEKDDVCCGDLVLILFVAGADYQDGAGVYARNLRTKKSGWLGNYCDLHFKVVGCRGDIYPDLQDERPSALVPARAPAHYSMGPADLTNSVTEMGTTGERLVGTAEPRLRPTRVPYVVGGGQGATGPAWMLPDMHHIAIQIQVNHIGCLQAGMLGGPGGAWGVEPPHQQKNIRPSRAIEQS
jgi:hypothetical protein